MKKKTVSLLLCASMAMSLTMGTGMLAMASEETEAVTEEAAESANYPLTISTYN